MDLHRFVSAIDLRRVQEFKRAAVAILLGLVLSSTAPCQELRPDDCPSIEDPLISEISTDISPRYEGQVTDKLPTDCNQHRAEQVAYSALELQPTGSIGKPYHYGAHFFHRPLYFEDPILERYGRSHGRLQPLISGVKFYGSALLLPVKMWRLPPHSCVSTPPCM